MQALRQVNEDGLPIDGVQQVTTLWPEVAADDFCGEHQPLPSAPVNVDALVLAERQRCQELVGHAEQERNLLTGYAARWLADRIADPAMPLEG